MPRYKYTAKSRPRQVIRGDIEAESEQDAVNKLNQRGYFPISVEAVEPSIGRQEIGHFRRISNRDIVLFSEQLSSLIGSGVNILTSLTIISNQTPNKYLKAVLRGVISRIKDGRLLSESLAGYPGVFSELYIAMIHSGEAGGSLEVALARLADFLGKDEEFKSSLRSSLTYPFFVFSVGAFTVIVLIGFVIPRLVAMFEDMGQALPLPTKILIDISGFLRGYWWLILAIIFIALFLLRRLRRKPQGKVLFDKLRLRLAIAGEITLKTEISRLARTLSLLLSSGIAITRSLDIATSVLKNQVLKLEAEKFREGIAGGLSFSKCLSDSRIFPAFVTDIVTVGEETGKLEKALIRIADDYEREADRALKTFSRMLEPVIILVMGLLVGFIVLSMLLPIFQINLLVR